MTEERRWQIGALFLELCDRAPEEWEPRLDAACGEDASLRGEVLSLLREDRSTGGFLPTSDAGPEVRLAELLKRMPAEKPPQEIAGYKVLGILGRGSMGIVYEAEQARPHRRVALKVRAAGLDSERERRRFEREAEILGRLHHPGIAQIHEWGVFATDAGAQPYLVLELVDGKPLVRWADERRLGLRERLELFMRVCTAVQHAHQQGVIHRDLKPSNILVVDSGQPKVLDFGIARSLNKDSLQTMEGAAVIGTLAYMSPEQAEGKTDALDTRTDVHALGVILHELLTGRLPYEVKGKPIHVALRILIGDEPHRLHHHAPRLRGDLDHIVAKALEKDPDRRYSSVQALGEDIGRYLRGDPILARPGTTVYQLGKWIRRNRILTGGITTTLVALAAGLVVALVLKENSDRSATLAKERGDALAQINQSLEEKTLESEERRKEAEAQRDDVLRLSALQDLDDLVARADKLWPAHPESIERYQAWLNDAQKLVDKLPSFEAKLADLRSRAVPWTNEEQARHRAEHPKLKELEAAQRNVDYLKRLRSLLKSEEPSAERTPQKVGLDLSSLPESANEINSLAWPLIDPDRKDWGGEAKGLALARRALELAANLSPEERAWIRDTLAWALFANGRFDEAVAEEERAVKEAAADRQREFQEYLERLKKKIGEEIGPGNDEAWRKHVAELEQHIAELEAEVSQRPEWLFADGRDKWWHNQLEKLVKGLKSFSERETSLFSSAVSADHGWGVKKRLEFAHELKDGFAAGGDYTRKWSEALPAIRGSYPGLDLKPQMGLLPIGPDPESGLWEFAHLQTGEPAERGLDGRIMLKEETGLVFVLLPGGTFTIGAQAADPGKPNYDPQAETDEGPPHEVTLSPFFLAKYEMIQGQWKDFTGTNPSSYGPHRYSTSWNVSRKGWSALHPVETVSWEECTEVLTRLGLLLPTNAQWEYGCRAGTTSVYWCGDDKECLQGVANLQDAFGQSHGNERWSSWESWLNDGQSVHGEIGIYRLNGFGLADMHGNVWEWCVDGYDATFYSEPVTMDPVCGSEEHSLRVTRGGGFDLAASYARSAIRAGILPSKGDSAIGVRPVRCITGP